MLRRKNVQPAAASFVFERARSIDEVPGVAPAASTSAGAMTQKRDRYGSNTARGSNPPPRFADAGPITTDAKNDRRVGEPPMLVPSFAKTLTPKLVATTTLCGPAATAPSG